MEFEWKVIYKPLEKFGISFLELVIAVILMLLSKNGWFLILIPILETLRNIIKHRNKNGKS